MSKKKSASWKGVLALVVILGAAGAWGKEQGYFFAVEEDFEIMGAPVRRGRIDITVTERGNLTAKNAASIRSEVEGRAILLFLIEEGIQVEVGDLVAEIDTSLLVDQRVAQQIVVQSARATATKTREAVEIQGIENESQIAKAEQEVDFAQLDLEKYVGSSLEGLSEMDFTEVLALSAGTGSDDVVQLVSYAGGNREQEIQKFRDDILLAEENLKQAEDKMEWSRKLAEKDFVVRTELEADELNYTRNGILLEQAQRALYLLKRYEQPKEWATLQGALKEAQRQLRKAKKQEVAMLADFQAAKEAAIVKLELEEVKLEDVTDQISKGRLYAPVAGMVVYGRVSGGRSSSSEPVVEGGEVRERQEIVSIPGEGGMIAEASIHESSLEQVVEGLPVILRVDALPGREFSGVVGRVAVLPDKNSWWANPNLRLYKTEILVDGADADMRPGMSCSIEILVDTAADVIFVPVQAVHHSGGHAVAWVRTGSGTEERSVEVGRHNEKWIEVTTGLIEGEVVLLSPPVGFQIEAAEDEPPSGPKMPAASPDLGGGASTPRAEPSGGTGERRSGRPGGEGRRPGGSSGERPKRPGGQSGERPKK